MPYPLKTHLFLLFCFKSNYLCPIRNRGTRSPYLGGRVGGNTSLIGDLSPSMSVKLSAIPCSGVRERRDCVGLRLSLCPLLLRFLESPFTKRATCAASGFGGGLLVLPAICRTARLLATQWSGPARPSHCTRTSRQIQGIATSYMQLRTWPRRMQIACILIPCPWPRCSPSPPSPPRQLRAVHDSSSPRLSRGRRPPCRHSTAARPGPTDRHYSDR